MATDPKLAEALDLVRRAKPVDARARVVHVLKSAPYSDGLAAEVSEVIAAFRAANLKKHVKALVEQLEAWQLAGRARQSPPAAGAAAPKAMRITFTMQFRLPPDELHRWMSFPRYRHPALFGDYLPAELGEAGVRHGELNLVWVGGRFEGTIEYHAPRPLLEPELTRLHDHTRGQLTDGIGEDMECCAPDGVVVHPYWVGPDPMKVVQTHDPKLSVPAPVRASAASTDLFAAIRAGDLPAIERLLAAGALAEVAKDHSALRAAIWTHSQAGGPLGAKAEEVALLVLGHMTDLGSQSEALVAAAGYGMVRVVTRLLDGGVPVDARRKGQPGWGVTGGRTAFMEGANHPPMIALLLARGADPKLVDEAQENAFFRCMEPECMRLLLEAGVDPRARNERGWTPMKLLEVLREGNQKDSYLRKYVPRYDAAIAALRALAP